MTPFCINRLIVSGHTEEVKQWQTKAGKPFALNNLLPIPQNFADRPNRRTWWCIKHWGTSCEIYDVITGYKCEHGNAWAQYDFNSTLTAPVAAIDHAAKEFPELTFKLLYEQHSIVSVGKYYAICGKGKEICKPVLEEWCDDECKGTYPIRLFGTAQCNKCGQEYTTKYPEEEYF